MHASSRQDNMSKASETFYEGTISSSWEQVIMQHEEHAHIFSSEDKTGFRR